MDKTDADEMSQWRNRQSDFSLEIFFYLYGETYWGPVCYSYTLMSSSKCIKKLLFRDCFSLRIVQCSIDVYISIYSVNTV